MHSSDRTLQSNDTQKFDETLLVTGAGGLLGSSLVVEAATRGFSVIAAYHSNPTSTPAASVSISLDITDSDAFEHILSAHPVSAVINCAAMTDVDECEGRPEAASLVNGTAPGEMAQICDEYDVDFCQISTDYVFSNPKTCPIPETEDPDPVQVYGKTKYQGETLVRERHTNPLIARISFVFGVRRTDDTLHGLPAWILERLRDRLRVPLYTDQRISPTLAKHAAETVLRLLSEGQSGTYHCSNAGCTTPYEFGIHLTRQHLNTGMELTDSATLADVDPCARRPRQACLDVSAVGRTLGRPQPSWQVGLNEIANRLQLK